MLVSCSEEPNVNNDLPVRLLIQIIDEYKSQTQFNSPVNPPEYLIINSARDIANLPKGTLAAASEYEYSKIDFAKYTLIVVTSVIYCQPFSEEDNWIWAGAYCNLTKDYNLDIRYNDCSVFETGLYSDKCKTNNTCKPFCRCFLLHLEYTHVLANVNKLGLQNLTFKIKKI